MQGKSLHTYFMELLCYHLFLFYRYHDEIILKKKKKRAKKKAHELWSFPLILICSCKLCATSINGTFFFFSSLFQITHKQMKNELFKGCPISFICGVMKLPSSSNPRWYDMPSFDKAALDQSLETSFICKPNFNIKIDLSPSFYLDVRYKMEWLL